MKRLQWLLLIVLIAAAAAPLTAQTDTSFTAMFTDHRVHDTLPLMEQDHSVRAWVYVFVDAKSCFTCLGSLNALQEKQQHDSGLQIVVFLAGKDQVYADFLKKRYGWRFPVIADPVFAYNNRYHVQALPFLFVLDGAGTILAMDKCGGTHLTTPQIETMIDRIPHAPGQTTLEHYSAVRRFTVSSSGGDPLIVGSRHYVVYAPNQSKYYLLDANFLNVYVIDSTGVVERSYDLSTYGSLVRSPLPPSLADGDSLLLCADVGLAGNRVFYLLNLNTGSVTDLKFDEGPVREGYNVETTSVYDPQNHRVVVGLLPKGNQKMSASQPTLLMADRNGAITAQFGTPDSLLVKYAMSVALDSRLGVDSKGYIYECQSPTRRLNVYDTEGRLVRSRNLAMGSAWKDFAEDLDNPRSQPLSFWIDLNRRMSRYNYVVPDAEHNQVGIVYLNAEYPNGIADPHSAQAVLSQYLHRENLEGRASVQEDILLPDGSSVFAMKGRMLGVAEYDNDRVEIVWYQASSN